MAKKPPPEDEGVSQEWLASYADAMTLLLAFFIMMFAFALIDEGKYFDFKVGVMAALGIPDPLTDNTDSILSEGTGVTPEVGLTPIAQNEAEAEAEEKLREALAGAGLITLENADDLAELLRSEFKAAGAAEYVDVGVDERGVFIRFDGRVLFESGRAELDTEGLVLLATAADVLQIIDNPLEVEGHTDSQATDGVRWPSNWELSSARSSRVVRWMIEPGSIPATRLAVVALADTKPRSNNNTATGRQENRRVEIVTRVVQEGLTRETGAGTEAEGTPADGTEPAAETNPDGTAGDGTDVEVLDPGATDSGNTDAGGAATGDDLSGQESIDPIGDPIGIGGPTSGTGDAGTEDAGTDGAATDSAEIADSGAEDAGTDDAGAAGSVVEDPAATEEG